MTKLTWSPKFDARKMGKITIFQFYCAPMLLQALVLSFNAQWSVRLPDFISIRNPGVYSEKLRIEKLGTTSHRGVHSALKPKSPRNSPSWILCALVIKAPLRPNCQNKLHNVTRFQNFFTCTIVQYSGLHIVNFFRIQLSGWNILLIVHSYLSFLGNRFPVIA